LRALLLLQSEGHTPCLSPAHQSRRLVDLSKGYCEIVRDAGTMFGNIAQGQDDEEHHAWQAEYTRGKVGSIGLLARK
jgi:hypothetical protein